MHDIGVIVHSVSLKLMLCAFVSLPPEAASEWEAACKSFPPEVKQDGPRELTPAAVATTAFQALSPSLAKLTFAAGPDGVDTAGPTSSSNSTEFRRFGLELFKHVLCGAVSPVNAVRLLADALSTSPAASPAAASILADIAWLTGMEIEESGGLSGEPTADWKKSSEFGR